MTTAKTKTEPLTRREREIMNALFALGNRVSAEEIRGRLTNPPGDSSVRVMLRQAGEEGLSQTSAGRLTVYLLGDNLAGCREAHGAAAVRADLLWRLSAADDDSPGVRGAVDRRRVGRTQERNRPGSQREEATVMMPMTK